MKELKRCKYCQDTEDTLNLLAEIEGDMGDFGEVVATAAISCFDKNYHPAMGFYLTFRNTDLTETDLQWMRLDINYCPVCGRKMQEG